MFNDIAFLPCYKSFNVQTLENCVEFLKFWLKPKKLKDIKALVLFKCKL